MPLFQNDSKFETFHTKMSSACSFIFMQISHFHKNGFALKLALKQRHKGTRNWPIFQSQRIQYTTPIHCIEINDADLIASDDTVYSHSQLRQGRKT